MEFVRRQYKFCRVPGTSLIGKVKGRAERQGACCYLGDRSQVRKSGGVSSGRWCMVLCATCRNRIRKLHIFFCGFDGKRWVVAHGWGGERSWGFLTNTEAENRPASSIARWRLIRIPHRATIRLRGLYKYAGIPAETGTKTQERRAATKENWGVSLIFP
jgi:hypothetical protein